MKSLMEDNSHNDTTEFSDEGATSEALDIRRRASELLDISERLETHVEHEPLELSRRCSRRVLIGLVLLAFAVVGLVSGLARAEKKEQKAAVAAAPPGKDDEEEDMTEHLCPQDVLHCPDGSTVSRNPIDRCLFYPCPGGIPEDEQSELEQAIVCMEGNKVCTDGTIVTRVGPLCEFQKCAEGACIFEDEVCPDGSIVQRDPNDNCNFTPCPEGATQEPTEEVSVTGDDEENNCRMVKMCTDLTTVQASGPNCELEPCPPGACLVDSFECPDGSVVGRDPDNDCKFAPCVRPTETAEEMEAGESQVEELAEGECPPGINPREVKMCPDLTFVTRDGPNCEFGACPP